MSFIEDLLKADFENNQEQFDFGVVSGVWGAQSALTDMMNIASKARKMIEIIYITLPTREELVDYLKTVTPMYHCVAWTRESCEDSFTEVYCVDEKAQVVRRSCDDKNPSICLELFFSTKEPIEIGTIIYYADKPFIVIKENLAIMDFNDWILTKKDFDKETNIYMESSLCQFVESFFENNGRTARRTKKTD